MHKMTKITQESQSPQTELQQTDSQNTEPERQEQPGTGLLQVVRTMLLGKPDTTLRETIEEYIDDQKTETTETPSVSDHEKQLLGNILKLRDLTAFDVMIPRADIIAVNKDATEEELLDILANKLHSRLPVYKETLDNVIGSIHAKDIISALATGKKIDIPALVRDMPLVSPSMKVLDLLLQMRMTGKHMVLVIDEFGGVDGLIAIGDVIEAVVGEIDDEHDPEEQPEVQIKPDGTIIADARLDLEDLEKRFGVVLTPEEKEENDTLGGLIFMMAGQVPARGEILKHESGLVFEILDADTRRIKSVSVKNLPNSAPLQTASD